MFSLNIPWDRDVNIQMFEITLVINIFKCCSDKYMHMNYKVSIRVKYLCGISIMKSVKSLQINSHANFSRV